MKIINGLKHISDLSLALGFFDGLHLGHRGVIDGAIEYAKYNSCKSAVVTFKNHPSCYLKNVIPKYILSQQDKYAILERVGLDYVIELNFEDICKMTPKEYLKNVLIEYFSPKAIFSGFNHHFGHNRSGNVKFLSDWQDKYNYVYFATPPIMLFGDVISSTNIRNLIAQGNISLANEMLGRLFYVKGKVVKGKQLGRTIGIPTANIMYPDSIIEPPYGAYKVNVEFEDGSSKIGVANFGLRPTVSETSVPVLETHILDYNENLYGQNIKVKFLRLIRPEYRFDSVDELRTQILMDIQSIKK